MISSPVSTLIDNPSLFCSHPNQLLASPGTQHGHIVKGRRELTSQSLISPESHLHVILMETWPPPLRSGLSSRRPSIYWPGPIIEFHSWISNSETWVSSVASLSPSRTFGSYPVQSCASGLFAIAPSTCSQLKSGPVLPSNPCRAMTDCHTPRPL